MVIKYYILIRIVIDITKLTMLEKIYEKWLNAKNDEMIIYHIIYFMLKNNQIDYNQEE